jgi:hypothetical protein
MYSAFFQAGRSPDAEDADDAGDIKEMLYQTMSGKLQMYFRPA